MRNLYVTMAKFDKDSIMAYCSSFDDIKGVLDYCNRHGKPFKNIYYYAGNEAVINDVIGRLQCYLIEHKLIDKESNEPLQKGLPMLRKIVVFLFANTDAAYKYNLLYDKNLIHLTGVCPLMPRFMTIKLLIDLNLVDILMEVLSYTPYWFAFQYIGDTSTALQAINDPYTQLVIAEKLIKAVCVCSARLEMRQIDAVDQKNICSQLTESTMRIFQHFHTPDTRKLSQFSKKKLVRYSGFVLKHLLQMTLFSFDIFESPAMAEPSFDIEIYNFCNDVCKEIKPRKESSNLLKKHQLEIINLLLNALQNKLMLVDLKMFVDWVDIDLSYTETLQQKIGNLTYMVHERIVANPLFAHNIKEQLLAISIAPRTLKDIINESTIGDILRKLDENIDDKTKTIWFNELFKRNVVFGNDECLETIRDNIRLISPENCKQILNYLKEIKFVQSENDPNANENETTENNDIDLGDFTELTDLILTALHNFCNIDLIELIDYEIKQFGPLTILCCHLEDFQQRSTEFLNKMTTSFKMHQFLQLCFENPSQMWQSFFNLVFNYKEHIPVFCRVVCDTRRISEQYFNSLFTDAVCDPLKINQKYFPEMVCEIYFSMYYPDRINVFFKQFVHKSVMKLLDLKDFHLISRFIRALNLIDVHGQTTSYKPLNFAELTPPVIIMVAQIMDNARWDIMNYSNTRVEIVRECIVFVQSTTKKFLPVASSKDRNWLASEIQGRYRPSTRYYLQKYILESELVQKEFDLFLIPVELMNKTEAEMFLIMNYVRCTMKETEWLVRSERFRPHITNVMIMLGTTVIEANSPNAVHNYVHCVANYINIVKKILLPQVQNDRNETEKLLMKMLEIIKSAEALDVYDDVFMNIQQLWFSCFEQCIMPFEGTQDFISAVQDFIRDMKDSNAKNIFLHKFDLRST